MDQDSGAPPPDDVEPEKVVREPTEGVRIIGAEEAAEAAGRSDVVSRLPSDRPRFGDRPKASDDDAPAPLKLPAPEAEDPNTFGAVPIISVDSPPPPGIGGGQPERAVPSSSSPFSDDDDLEFDAPPPPGAPTDPFDTGRTMAADEDEFGDMLGGRRARRAAAREEGGRRGRRGRRRRGGDDDTISSPFEDLLVPEETPEVGDHDLPHWTRPPTGEVPRVLAGEAGFGEAEPATGGGPRYHDEHAQHEADDFSDLADITRIESIPEPGAGEPAPVTTFDDLGAAGAPPEPLHGGTVYAPEPGYGPEPGVPSEPADAPGPEAEPAPSLTASAPYPEARHRGPLGDLGHLDDGTGAGRDLPTAIGVGVGLFVGYVVLCFIGTAAVTLLAVVVIVMAAIEFFNAVRRVGYHPAVLPGLVASASLVLAMHWKQGDGFLMVTFLTIVVLMLWYVLGLQHERAVANIGITLFGVMWIGGLGSFAGLLLALPDGIGVLTGAIIATVAYDVGAYFVGRQFGKTPLSPSSPNKTIEGLVGGGAAAIVLSVLLLGMVPGLFPWSVGDAFFLGLAVAIVAPLGDLCESMLKRDLGLKDMGSILPGHGGLLDRFDALLFVLPVTYFVYRLFEVYLNTP